MRLLCMGMIAGTTKTMIVPDQQSGRLKVSIEPFARPRRRDNVIVLRGGAGASQPGHDAAGTITLDIPNFMRPQPRRRRPRLLEWLVKWFKPKGGGPAWKNGSPLKK